MRCSDSIKSEIQITFVDDLAENDVTEEASHAKFPEGEQVLSVKKPECLPPGQETKPESSTDSTIACDITKPPATNACSPIAVEWREFQSPSEMLSSVGGDQLKAILSHLGLKCGGTPLERAERLFSVRNLSAAEIPDSLRAGRGKKRKAK